MLATRSRHGVVKHLVALAVSLDRDGIKFGLGDNGNLSVEVDAELRIRILGPGIHDPGHIWPGPGIMLWVFSLYLLSGHNDFWGLNTNFCHFYFLR